MTRAVRLLFGILVVALGMAIDVNACSCVMSFIHMQPCSAYWNADVVFAGTVTEVGPMLPIKGSDGKLFSANGRVTRFRVDDAFRGVAGAVVETYDHGTSCDYHFKQGEKYFVYGARDPKDGRTYVGSCSATKSLESAAPDVEFARALARGDSLPDMIGVVSRETREDATTYRGRKPMGGVEVAVQGNGKSVTTITDDNGQFRFYGLPPGKYQVTAKTPGELRNLYGPRSEEVTIRDGRCNGTSFTVSSLSTVKGTVVDHTGKPAAVRLSLVPLNEAGEEVAPAEGSVDSYSNSEGVFAFDWIAPGRYRLAINAKSQPGSYDPPYPRVYLPGVVEPSEASIITVAEGQGYEAREFRLPPPLTEKNIEGLVFLPDGSPVAGALIMLEFTERRWFETFTTDSQGRFKIKAFAGYRYLVSAELRKEIAGKWTATHSEPVEVVVGDVIPQLKLVINRKGFYQRAFEKQKPEVPK